MNHSHDLIGASAPWVRDQLARNDVRLDPGSSLAKALDNLAAFRESSIRRDWFHGTGRQYLDLLDGAYGADFLTKSLHRGAKAGLALDRSDWQQIAKGDPIITRESRHSNARARVWEIVIASVAQTFSPDVEMPDPPDVLCTFRGKRFAVEAKLIDSAEGMDQHIRKASSQVAGGADGGLIFVNVTGIWPALDMFRDTLARRLGTEEAAVAQLKSAVARWCDNNFHLPAWQRRILRRGKPMGVAFFVPAILAVAGEPGPAFYTHMPIVWGTDSDDYAFATAFVQACDSVLGFRAGG